jgi:hypothetical protein
MLLPIERKTQEIAVDVPALDDLTRNSLHLAVYFLLHRGHIPLKGCTLASPLHHSLKSPVCSCVSITLPASS